MLRLEEILGATLRVSTADEQGAAVVSVGRETLR